MNDSFEIIIQDSIVDPYFNLASEEFLLKRHNQNPDGPNYLFIYRNEDSVVCGKNQSIWSEANLRYCRENEIKIAKRVSGGGSVYHDLGNLNFCYITERRSEWVSNFQIFNEPVISFLNKLGIKAYNNDRNDILLDGNKISGNAQHLFANSLISHATLLYDANLEKVSNALKHGFDNVESRAIDSKRVKVTNIRNHGLKYPTDEFLELFIQFYEGHFGVKRKSGFDLNSIQEIESLKKSRYQTEEWIFGKSPQTKIELSGRIKDVKYEIRLSLEKGIIKDVDIRSNDLETNKLISDFLSETYFNYNSLLIKLEHYIPSEKVILKEFLDSVSI